MLTREIRIDGRLIGTIVDGAGLMLEGLKVLHEVGPARAAKAIAEAMDGGMELEVSISDGAQGVLRRLMGEGLRCPPVTMCERACVEFGTDPRPDVARAPAPVHLSPSMLRMDAASRKYQSTQKNWRRYDGTHFKKNKRIK